MYQLPSLLKHEVTPLGFVPVRSSQCTDKNAVGIREKVERKLSLQTRAYVNKVAFAMTRSRVNDISAVGLTLVCHFVCAAGESALRQYTS